MTHQVNPIISNLRLSAFIVFLPLFSCSTAQIESASEGWVNQIRIDNLAPSIITRGTKLIINGDGFVGSIGTSRVILEMQDRLTHRQRLHGSPNYHKGESTTSLHDSFAIDFGPLRSVL